MRISITHPNILPCLLDIVGSTLVDIFNPFIHDFHFDFGSYIEVVSSTDLGGRFEEACVAFDFHVFY